MNRNSLRWILYDGAYLRYQSRLCSIDLLGNILCVFVVFSVFYSRSLNLDIGFYVHQSGSGATAYIFIIIKLGSLRIV